MTPTPKKGKVFMQDKDKLLKLADMITSGKELDTRQKIDRTKASASYIDAPSRQNSGRRSKGSLPSASHKLHVAKELVAARKARRKREKVKARKSEEHASKRKPDPDGTMVKHPSPTTASRKRVSFA